MRSILVVYTGGTIGMRIQENGYSPCPDFIKSASIFFNKKYKDTHVEIVSIMPPIDSSDLHPSSWNDISILLKKSWERYDGFIILHGTDTLSFTASALSFMLGEIDKPVILTGSQIPFKEPRTDSVNNLSLAIEAISNNEMPKEVCVAFHDRILRGNRTKKISSNRFCAFDSPNFPWLCESGIKLSFNSLHGIPTGSPNFSTVDFQNSKVGVLWFYPGLSFSQAKKIIEDKDVRSLLMVTYGVGNPSCLEGRLEEYLYLAVSRKLPIFNVSQCLNGVVSQGAYASGHRLNKFGVVPCNDITFESAIAKLKVLFGRGYNNNEVEEKMRTSLVGEMTAI